MSCSPYTYVLLSNVYIVYLSRFVLNCRYQNTVIQSFFLVYFICPLTHWQFFFFFFAGYVDFSKNKFSLIPSAQLEQFGVRSFGDLARVLSWGFDFRDNPVTFHIHSFIVSVVPSTPSLSPPSHFCFLEFCPLCKKGWVNEQSHWTFFLNTELSFYGPIPKGRRRWWWWHKVCVDVLKEIQLVRSVWYKHTRERHMYRSECET